MASELEDGLAERALEVFSAEGLQRRWHLLQREAEAESRPEPSPSEAPPAAAPKGPSPARPPARALPAWADPDQAGEAPSDFSVLTDSLQQQVRQIYDDVQHRLPSTLTGQDEEDDERVSLPAGFASATSGDEAEGSEADSLRDTAIRLFGSANLGDVVADLSKADGSTGTRGTRATSYDAPSTAQGRDTETDRDERRGHAAEDEDESSGNDSVDEDFQAMRKALKVSSQKMAEDAPAESRKPLAAQIFKPAAALVGPSSTGTTAAGKAPVTHPTGGFVRLELVESSEDDADADDEGEEESDASSEDEQDSHLRLLNRLQSSAPEGNCSWDVWLEVLRRWPQLKVKLNSPDFARKGNDLRVKFDVDLLKSIIEEVKAARADAREKRRETRDNMESRIHEFIQEAERQRELMKHRLGSFVLAPKNEKLEEALRRQKASREARAKEKADSERMHRDPAKPVGHSQRAVLHANQTK